MERSTLTKQLIGWSAILTAVAGVIHVWLFPIHMEHAPAHGLFFLLVGIAQIVWGVAVWRTPSLKLYYIGAVMAGWLILLYGITRWLPAPFSHGAEAVEPIDIVCKFCEVLGMITLCILIFQGLILHADRSIAWRAIAGIVVVSFLASFVTYGVARAAEPILPWLSSSEDEHHDEIVPSSKEDHQHEDSIPTAEHDR